MSSRKFRLVIATYKRIDENEIEKVSVTSSWLLPSEIADLVKDCDVCREVPEMFS